MLIIIENILWGIHFILTIYLITRIVILTTLSFISWYATDEEFEYPYETWHLGPYFLAALVPWLLFFMLPHPCHIS